MGLFDFFKKEAECDSCSKVVFKKELYGFDSTVRGRYAYGKNLKLCQDCFFCELNDSIKKYKGKVLFYKPVNNENAIHFYPFYPTESEKKEYHYTENFPKKHLELVPEENRKCNVCDKKANFAWCSNNENNIDTYNFEDYEKEDFEVEYLCPECLTAKLKALIKDDEIFLYEFLIPCDLNADGIFISGEC